MGGLWPYIIGLCAALVIIVCMNLVARLSVPRWASAALLATGSLAFAASTLVVWGRPLWVVLVTVCAAICLGGCLGVLFNWPGFRSGAEEESQELEDWLWAGNLPALLAMLAWIINHEHQAGELEAIAAQVENTDLKGRWVHCTLTGRRSNAILSLAHDGAEHIVIGLRFTSPRPLWLTDATTCLLRACQDFDLQRHHSRSP